jgi:hypothetical protein
MQEVSALRPANLETVSRLIEGDPKLFRDNFNRADFGFSHHIANHPLFGLPRLVELAKTMTAEGLYIETLDPADNARYAATPPAHIPSGELLDRIERGGAWMVIRRAMLSPEYAVLIDQGLDEFQQLTDGALPSKMLSRGIEIFVTSPNRKTFYHIDQGCKLFLQIRGEKEFHLFDRYDREVLPEEELERFWAVDSCAAVYKPQFQSRAHTYDLKPGDGIHIPVNAPHWVQNNDDVSVSLSIHFRYRESELANIYRTNYLLRKMGLRPTPPGRSALRDRLKGSVVGRMFDVAKKLGVTKRSLKRK